VIINAGIGLDKRLLVSMLVNMIMMRFTRKGHAFRFRLEGVPL